jgi:glycosyltransferase involved in cell wall biosynthesis
LSRGHTVHYLALTPFPIEHTNCHFHRLWWPNQTGDSLIFWIYFYLAAPCLLLILALRVRATHAFAFNPTYGYALQPTRCFARIPLSVFLRADILENHRLAGRARWLVWLEHNMEALAIQGVYLVGASRALTSAVIGRHKWVRPIGVTTLPNDVVLKRRQNVGIHQQSLHAVCVGVLEARKNQRLLLDVMRSLRDLPLILSYYGGGPDESALRREVETLGLGSSVQVCGWIPSEQIWPHADLLLFPSRHEGSPNAVLEALGHGVPVLASDIPEHREVLPIEDLLPADTPFAWAERLRTILNERGVLLRMLVNRQLEFAEKLAFDWDAAVTKIILTARTNPTMPVVERTI